MKKNKKYWKKQAKYFENQYWDAEYTVALLEEQLRVFREDQKDYEYLDKQYMEALDKYEDQKLQLEAAKRDLNLLRQYNIGKKSADFDNYKAKQIVMKSSVPPSNTTSTSGSGYSYNTTFDFTQPKKKKRWRRS
jgi:hypothetical protein